MDKDFLKVDLLPGYKEDKFVSNLIYRIVFFIFIVFFVFYFMFLPYYNARVEHESAVFKSNQLKFTQAVYQARTNEDIPLQINVDYQETLEFIDDNEFPLHLWLNQILSIEIEGYRLYTVDFAVASQFVDIYALFESDRALLEFEQELWSIYWVDSVRIGNGGPGDQTIRVSYSVGDSIEE